MYEKEDRQLKKMLSEKRYIHSLNTAETAAALARLYGADPNRAYLAGLLHDAAKDLSGEELILRARNAGIKVDKFCLTRPHLLHAVVGAVIAKEQFGLCDEELLSAIANHTMGKPNMTLMEKIIFLADLIEPSREYAGVEDVREAAKTDMDEAIIKAYDGIIAYVLLKREPLHPVTVKARNYMIFACEEKQARLQ